MTIEPPSRRDRGEPVAPMINIVFLLLIFFMMAATLAPPDPIETTPPVSSSEDNAQAREALLIGADGTLAWGEARGEAVFEALSQRTDTDLALTIRADASAPARMLAEVLSRLHGLGVKDITMTVEQR